MCEITKLDLDYNINTLAWLAVKLSYHTLEVVSHYRDPQLQVSENYQFYQHLLINRIQNEYGRD